MANNITAIIQHLLVREGDVVKLFEETTNVAVP